MDRWRGFFLVVIVLQSVKDIRLVTKTFPDVNLFKICEISAKVSESEFYASAVL